MQDDLEQKIHKLMVMMDKLVTEDDGHSKPFRCQIYQSSRGRNQNRGNFHVTCTGDTHCIIKILEVDIEITLTVEETLVIVPEVVRDTGTITMITRRTITEVKVMIGIEVDH